MGHLTATDWTRRSLTTVTSALFLASHVIAATLVDESFDALSDGSLHGQGGWSASPTNAATVQSGVTHGGSARACELANTAGTNGWLTVEHALTGGQSGMVTWSDWYARPVRVSDPNAGGPPDAATVFYFNADGDVVVQDGAASVTVTGAPRAETNTWLRMTVRADYGRRRWSLWLDGTLVARDLAFVNPNAAVPGAIGFDEGAQNAVVSYVDTIRVGTTPPTGITYEPEGTQFDTIPFVETFENMFAGSADGQRGWQAAPPASATAQIGERRQGVKACRIAGHPVQGTVPRLSHDFIAGEHSGGIIRTRFQAKPVFTQSPDPVPPSDVAAAFHVEDGTGHVVVFDGATRLVLDDKPALQEGQWVEFLITCDYRRKKWSLEMNGEMMASELAFRNPALVAFSAFGVDEGSLASTSFIDDISIRPRLGTLLLVR